jgi:uncharacterized OsmC-like protein
MATVKARHGVDLDRLTQTVGAIDADPAIGRFTFKATTTWQEGGRSVASIGPFVHAGNPAAAERHHELVGDEPDVLLGSDAGPNAVELALAALGFCYSVGFSYHAAARGYELEELTYRVEGDIDLRDFVGLGSGPRPGFTEVRVRATARAANATPEQLQDLCRFVQDTSPIGDVIANAVPLKVSLRTT